MRQRWAGAAWRRSLVLAAALAMLLGACGDAPSTSDQPSTTGLDFDDLGDQIEQENIEIDRLVRACMTAQGFTYVPPNRVTSVGTTPIPASRTDRGHAQEWGYGILTGLEAEQPWLKVLKVEDVQRQLDALQEQSDGEGRPYNLALYGSGNPTNFATTGDSGCLAEARTAVNNSPDSLATRNDQFEQANARLAADERIADLDVSWARCMTESGYDYSRRQDITDMLIGVADDFYRRLQSVQGSVVDKGDGPVEVAPNPELVAQFESDLAVEADGERELALADMDCFIPIADSYLDIEQEYFAELND